MNRKLIRRLRRELRAHPWQAGVLALLLAVAAYFWVPLLWGGGTPETAARQPTKPTGAGETANTTNGNSVPADRPAAQTPVLTRPWREIATAIDNDPCYRSTMLDLQARPFRRLAEPLLAAKAKAAAAKAAANSVAPAAGVTLTGTLVGGQRRIAFLNGRGYSEGSEVSTGDGGEPFVLAAVDAKSVTLVRGGERLQLKLRRLAAKVGLATGVDVPDELTKDATESPHRLED